MMYFLPRMIIERTCISLLDQRLVAGNVMESRQGRQIDRVQNWPLRYGIVKRINMGVNPVLFGRVLTQEICSRRECVETVLGHWGSITPSCVFDKRLDETCEDNHAC